MKNKLLLAVLVALIAISSLSFLATSVKASPDLSFNAAISSSSTGVAQTATYTFTITNNGTTALGSVNVTIPKGYLDVKNPVITQSPSSKNWTIAQTGNYIVLYSSDQGLSAGQSITFTVDVKNPLPAGSYKWVIGANQNNGTAGLSSSQFTVNIGYSLVITSILAASIIFVIAAGIAAINTAVNRVLINYFVGWEQYRVMQKEMNEYRQETMAAARANDKKQMEKLKKRQSQISNMQAKMMKPQMVQLGISFIYLIVWFLILTPTFGVTSMVYLPGIGPIPVVYWYPICSFFLGLIASRLLGIMPIEP